MQNTWMFTTLLEFNLLAYLEHVNDMNVIAWIDFN